jgi:hypothetical protein
MFEYNSEWYTTTYCAVAGLLRWAACSLLTNFKYTCLCSPITAWCCQRVTTLLLLLIKRKCCNSDVVTVMLYHNKEMIRCEHTR